MSILSSILGGQKKSVLNERHARMDMFNDVTRALGKRPMEVDRVIQEATEILGKNDRIVWYLRLWKISYLDRLAKRAPDLVSPDYVEKLVHDYSRRSNLPGRDVHAAAFFVSDPSFLVDLGHFLSLPIPSIQKHTFSPADTPETLMRKFELAEKEWAHQSRDAFADPDAHLMIKFPNGLAWYDLGRASCDQEAAAMGHGGNASRSTSGDRLLSLREVLPQGSGEVRYKPVLTFVLDQDGLLGEMKARFNQKPGREYHNEIVALLRDPIVQGIKGGGYKPENNFALSDLDEDTRLELLAEKPELRGLAELYRTYGIQDPRTQRVLGEYFRLHDIPEPYLKLTDHGTEYVIDEWSDLTHFLRETDDEIVRDLLAAYMSNRAEEFTALDDDQIHDIIARLGELEYNRLMRDLSVRPVPANDMNYHRAVRLAVTRIRTTHYYDMMLQAVNAVAVISADMKNRIRDQIQKYLDVGYTFHGGAQTLEMHTKSFSDPIRCVIPVRDLIEIITATGDEDEEFDYNHDIHSLEDIREAGNWTSVDWDRVAEDRADLGLAAHKGYGHIEQDPVLIDILAGHGLDIDMQDVAMRFVKAARL